MGDSVAGRPRAVTSVTVEGGYAEAAAVGCWNTHPDRTPDCAPALKAGQPRVAVDTIVGRYSPYYYGIVGLPSLFLPPGRAIYAMRLVSAAVVATLLTLAITIARRLTGARVILGGLALAITPMVLFLGGVINPNAVEIAAAVLVWVAALAVSSERFAAPPRLTAAGFFIGSAALVLARGLSVVWYGVILCYSILMFGQAGLRRFVSQRRQLTTATIGIPVLAAIAWAIFVGGLSLVPVGSVPGSTSTLTIIRTSLTKVGEQTLPELVGRLQWLEVRLPAAVYVFWAVAGGGLFLLGLSAARRWSERAALASLLAVVLATPVLAEALQARELAYFWQGRYTLPVATGIPISAAFLLALEPTAVTSILKRWAAIVAAGAAVSQLTGLVVAMHRNAVGEHGPLNFLSAAEWTPPLPFLFLLVLFAAALLIALVASALEEPQGAELVDEPTVNRALGVEVEALEPPWSRQ